MSAPPLTAALRETLALFDGGGRPMGTREVADRLDLGRRSSYDRLDRLADRDLLRTKKVGANARVWWRPTDGGGRTPSGDGDARDGSPTGPGCGDPNAEGGGRLEEEQLALLVEAVEEYAIFMLDADGRIRTWNRGAERIKGYEREDVLGRHFSTFYTESDRADGVPATNLAAAAAEGVTTDEGWRVRADGSTFWAHVTITAVHDDGGDLVGYGKVTRDMTDRREREQAVRRERNLLDRVLETSPIGVGLFHPDGSVDRVNARMAEFLGLDGGDVDDYALGDGEVLGPDGEPLAVAERPAGRVIETGEPVADQEVRLEAPDGGSRWLSVHAAPLTDDEGGLEHVVVTAADVSQRKRQARRLERQRDDLIEELEEMYERIDDAFCALDDGFRFTYVNERAETLLDRDEDELLGRRVDEVFPELTGTPLWDGLHRSLEAQTSSSYEGFFEPLDAWMEAHVYPSETGLSVYFRDISARKARERELERYERIVETVEDGIYLVDPDGRLTMVNQAYAEMTGYSREELVGMSVEALVDEETVERARAYEREMVEGELRTARFEADVATADGDTFRGEGVFSVIGGAEGEDRVRVGVVRDITERKERERELVLQRERLAALDDLNAVVRTITAAVIDRSSRREIERAVCAGLAESGSYEFAWFGDVDPEAGTVRARTEDGVEGFLDGIELQVDPDDAAPEGPTARALRTREMQTIGDLADGGSDERWRELAMEHGVRSMAAIPVVHEGVRYGAISVYADRPDAFTGDERAVLAHVGEIVGHAIAAIERKRALTSDEVVELTFRMPGVFDAFDLPSDEGRLTFDRAVPLADGTFLEYGSATADLLERLDDLVEAIPHWEAVRVLADPDGGDLGRFELRLDDPPVLSTVTALGGYVEDAVLEDGDYRMRIHLAPSADARRLIDLVRETYPTARLISKQQVRREAESALPLEGLLVEHLTERQRSALEAAFFAGYFEWPRAVTGEEVADALGVSAPTFHQHLRKAEGKLLGVALEDGERGGT